MPSEPRLIRGPCFDCEERCDCVWDGNCRDSDDEQTEPTPKLEPETRPNVPPRMM